MIVGDPQMTRKDAPEIATRLADRLGIDYFQLLDRLRRQDTRFQYLARRLPSTVAPAVAEELKEAGFKGLSTPSDPMREHPADAHAANLVWFIGQAEDKGPPHDI